MKIIALLPFKNEAWILPSYLSSITKVAHHIIALDDNSTDNGADLLIAAGATVIKIDTTDETFVKMSRRRQALLEAGRQAGGTHFIWLDADEILSANFLATAREKISKLKIGQKMNLRWTHFWKNTTQYLDDKSSAQGYIWKDFIVCDDPTENFSEKFLSESRTPGNWGTPYILPESEGVVLHFQFLNGEAMHYKHCWYRCQELIEGSRSAKRINATYVVNYDESSSLTTNIVPAAWIDRLILPTGGNTNSWHKEKILCDFDLYGIDFFEPIAIWYIPELHELFLERMGREPKVSVFPTWVLFINTYKNRMINSIREKNQK